MSITSNSRMTILLAVETQIIYLQIGMRGGRSRSRQRSLSPPFLSFLIPARRQPKAASVVTNPGFATRRFYLCTLLNLGR
jgi:hypothetical protein